MEYSIIVTDSSRKRHTYELSYEEMIEILNAIKYTPVIGNECFDKAKEKAAQIMNHMPVTDY